MQSICDALEPRRLLSGDFNFDGDDDIVTHDQTTGVVRVHFLDDDDNIFTGQRVIGVVGSQWRIVGIGNLDTDLSDDADILWQNTTNGRLLAWEMDGTTLSGFRAFPYANPALWEFAAAAEHDDDGGPDDLDLLWRHRTTGQLNLWHMDGNHIERFIHLPTEPNLNWQVVGMSEVDKDGPVDVDILFRNTQTGANRIWVIDDNVLARVVNLPPAGLAWRVAGYVDADDGDPGDIFWQHTATGQMVEWELDDDYTLEDTDPLPGIGPNRIASIGG